MVVDPLDCRPLVIASFRSIKHYANTTKSNWKTVGSVTWECSMKWKQGNTKKTEENCKSRRFIVNSRELLFLTDISKWSQRPCLPKTKCYEPRPRYMYPGLAELRACRSKCFRSSSAKLFLGLEAWFCGDLGVETRQVQNKKHGTVGRAKVE